MPTILKIYLLSKSFFNLKFSAFDILLAITVSTWSEIILAKHCPDWLTMIANLQLPNKLPEAWFAFSYNLLGGPE